MIRQLASQIYNSITASPLALGDFVLDAGATALAMFVLWQVVVTYLAVGMSFAVLFSLGGAEVKVWPTVIIWPCVLCAVFRAGSRK